MKTNLTPFVKAFVLLHLVFFFCFGNLYSQSPQLPLWNVAPNTINFGTTTTLGSLNSLNDYFGDSPTYLTNSISDASGNALFFVVDGIVYDKDGYKIDDFKRLGSILNEFSQEVSIVPVPGNCTSFYIVFGVRVNFSAGNSYFPVYATLDLTAQNINYSTDPTKKGALVYSTPGITNVIDLAPLTPYASTFTSFSVHNSNRFGLAVSPYRSSSNDHIMFIYGDNAMLSFTINSTGISYLAAPFGIDSGGDPIGFATPTGATNNLNYVEMELVQLGTGGNYRLGKVLGNSIICLADFDPVTSLIVGTPRYLALPTTASTFTETDLTGLEFSPNGQRIYYASWTNIVGTTAPVGYLDLSLSTPVATPMNFTGVSNLASCQIEMGHDGKMYFNGGTQLYTLSNPNSAAVAANWSASLALAAGYSGNYTKLLPDQMDGNFYNTSAIINSYTAGTFPYTAFIQTWTPTSNPFGGTTANPVGTAINPVIVLNNVTIPPGYNITIQGMTFKFRARTIDVSSGSPVITWGARVLVQNVTSTTGPQVGGRLTLNALGIIPSIFTSDDVCSNGMWEGVEVWGNQLLPQGAFSGLTAGKQGWFRMYSSSVISNAYIGALAGKKYYDATTTYVYNSPISYGGGIIQAFTSSEFLNNQFGAYFSTYNVGNNLSVFNLAKFTTNATFVSADGAKPNTMAFLNDIKGIYFKRCTFFNNQFLYPQLTTPSLYGIRGYHAQFFCIPALYGSTLGCTFDNFKYGVYATYYNNTKTVTLDYSTFTNNYRGTYLSGAQLVPTIVRNKYIIMNYAAGSGINRAYGLYMNACNEYKVEGNDFTTVGSSTTADDIGIIVNNSGPNANLVYRNTFHEVFGGIQAQSINCHIQSFDLFIPKNDFGLQLKCNQFTTIKNMDMGITSGCTDYHQGYSTSQAGNKFSHSFNTAYNDYYNYATADNAYINYSHHNDYNYSPQIGFYSPFPKIALTAAPAATPDNFDASADCLTTLSGFHLTPSPSDLKTQITSLHNLFIAGKALIDAGADPSLISAINSSMDLGTLKNLLMSKSPYLSDEVLIAALTRSNPLPNGHIREIIIANSPVTQPVKDVLNSISLPNGIRNQINAVQTGVSARSLLIEKLYSYQFQISMAKNDILRDYVNDTLVDVETDTIIAKIVEYEGIDQIANSKEKLADFYVEKQDYVMAETMLTAVEADPAKQNFVKIKRVNKNLKQSGQTTADLQTNIVEKQKVDEVASDDQSQGYELAINMLQEVFSAAYEEPIDETSSALHSYTPMESPAIEEAIVQPMLYPNPNNGSMQLDYSLNEGETGELKIMDITGRIVAQYNLNASENVLKIDQIILNNGMYLYQVLTNGEVVAADKLIITK